MDRNDLLVASRTEFLRTFADALDESIRQAEAHLFVKADSARSGVEQQRYLDARSFVMKSTSLVRQQILMAMERLLQRSFQTAYNSFRPSVSSVDASLVLLDTSVFEGELRIDQFTKRFRDEAEDELRDLNIRIALIFEQEDISERENPFRPYLISRSIASAFETMELPPADVDALVEQISEGMSGRIQGIYACLNELLAAHGLAAQLQLKIKKMPARLNLGGAPVADAASDTTPQQAAQEQAQSRFVPAAAPAPLPMSAPAPSPVDQLFDLVRGISAPTVASQIQGALPDAGMSELMPAQEGSAMQGAQTPALSNSLAAAPSPAMPVNASRGAWLNGVKSAGQVLRRFFAGPQMPVSADPEAIFGFNPPPALPANTPLTNSLRDMQLSQTPTVAEMTTTDGRLRNLILEERERLSDMTRDANEQMIIDIVAMLFEFILRDSHVPAEVRAQLGRLQFLVLKIALLDPEVFSKEYHDVRMLVNRIGSISLGLRQIDPSGERVSGEICRIVETLLADETHGVALFGMMLDELDAFVARELLAADQQLGRAVEAVEKAESRTLQFARISAMISQALSNLRVDDYLHDFLINAWARVVERTGRDHSAESHRFRLLVPDLVWSVAPKVLPEERQQLIKLVPSLIATLGEGVNLIDWPQEERHRMMSWLMEVHREGLRATHVPAPVPPLEMIRGFFAEFIANPEAENEIVPAAGERHLDTALLSEAIGELEASLDFMDQILDVDAVEDDAVVNAQDDEEDLQAYLKAGVMAEVNLDGKFKSARLNWIGGQSNHLILSIEGHDAPSMVTLRAFKRLLAGGRARFVEESPLFERAVAQLLETADQAGVGNPA